MAELAQGQQNSAIYWLEGPDSRRAVWNDPTDLDYVGGLEDDGVTGLDSSEVREAAYDAVEAHGGFHGNFWSGRRPVTIQSVITTNDALTIAGREAMMEKIRRASMAFSSDSQLIWFPGDPSVVATTRQNLVVDPSFEYDVVGNAPGVIQSGETPYGMLPTVPWTENNDAAWTAESFIVSTSNPTQGTKTLKTMGTKDATATERGLRTRTSLMPVVPGRTYSAKANVFIQNAAATTTSGALYMIIRWYDGNSTQLSVSSNSNVIAAGVTGAQTLTLNGQVAPAGASYAQIDILSFSTTSSDVVELYIDGVQLVAEATAGAYLDGDSSNSSWLGLVGFSRSVNRPNARYVSVRRQAGPRFTGAGMRKSSLVTLVAADPRIYSTEQYRTQVAHATDAWLENQGDFFSPAVYRVYGPYSAGTVTIDLTVGGSALQLKWTKGASPEGTAGHAIQLNNFYRSVLLDPTSPVAGTDRYGSLDFATGAEWPDIGPDARNKVRFDASGGGTTSATVLDVRWRDAWV